MENAEVADSVFVGYSAEIRNSEVGDGSFIYHGARVEGVEIPDDTLVPADAVVTSEKDVRALKEG